MSYIDGLKLFPHLIAIATGVDADTAGGTTLTFVNDATLDSHTPFLGVIEWESGTYAAATAHVRTGSTDLNAALALVGLDTDNNVSMSLMTRESALVNKVGAIDVIIGTPNGSAATFTIKIYGVSL